MARNYNELRAKMSDERRARSDVWAAKEACRMGLKDRSVMMVFTGESIETMAKRGGTGNWTASEKSVNGCQYLIATRNSHCEFHPGTTEPHRSGFLMAKVLGSSPSNEEGRIVIHFREYAEIDCLDAWPKNQLPFRYFPHEKLKEMAIDPKELNWQILK